MPAAVKLRRREDGSTEANAAQILRENWADIVKILQPQKPAEAPQQPPAKPKG